MFKFLSTSSNRFWSNLVITAWGLVFLFFLIVHPVWKNDKYFAPISWDVAGYYLYLPAIFIHQDIRELKWKDEMMQKYEPATYFYFAYLHPRTGNFVCSYTAGMAVAYSPFFFIAHGLAHISGYPTDGYSLPYMLLIYISGAFYAGLGLFVARKLLSDFFEDKVVAIALAWLIFGTNWLHYSTFDNGMTHAYLFTALASFLLFAHRWHQTKLLKYAVGMGLVGGWAGITRPTELLIGLVFVLWGVASWDNFKTRLQELWRYKMHLFTAAGLAFCLAVPQIIYWKWSANQWVYSGGYGEHHFEFFPRAVLKMLIITIVVIFFSIFLRKRFNFWTGISFWFSLFGISVFINWLIWFNAGWGNSTYLKLLHPFLWDGLWSIRKGWFIYTPIMLLTMIGFFPLYKNYKGQFWAIFLFFLINTWIVFSWSVWYYGGGFSARALVQSYALLLFPMAALIQAVQQHIVRFAVYTFAILCIALNLFQNWQYRYLFIGPEGMSEYNYWMVFGKTYVDKDDIKGVEFSDVVAPSTVKIEKIIYQEDSTANHDMQNAYISNSSQRRINLKQIPIQDFGGQPQQWLRANIWAYMENNNWVYEDMALLLAEIKDKNGKVYWQRYVKIPVLIGNATGECHNSTYGYAHVWGAVWIDIQLPEEIQPTDILDISVKNDGYHQFYVTDFSLAKE